MEDKPEPIPGTSPPEGKPPQKEPPASPENPGGGIEIEVRQPDILYSIAQNIVHGEDDFSKGISNTKLDGTLLSRERTNISAFEEDYGSGDRIDGTFTYNSWVYLSEERIKQGDHGYYSYDKVGRIHNILQGKGLEATLDTNSGIKGGLSTISIARDGYYVQVHFGLPNREAEEAKIMREVEAEKKSGKEDGYATKYELPKIEKGLNNGGFHTTLVDERRIKDGWEGYPKLKDKADFRSAALSYAEVYKNVLNAIYEEEGITPPDTSIILRPPIANQDSLAEIASVETETPIHLVEAQVTRDVLSFDEIAGQKAAVAEAKRLVLAINNPEVFERRGVKRPKGILFYGPPGTGKTMIAKAVAQEANAAFLEISAADIGTKWYGESERLMQKVFDLANKTVSEGKKVVIFFDELDSLAPSREDAHEATRKVVATLLQNMDGMKANPNVTIIAATNRPQDIDPALKRPGRIDKLIPVGLPDEQGRAAIVKVHIDKATKSAKEPESLFSTEIDLEHLGKITDGMSGADLANLVNLVLEEKTMAELEGQDWKPVTTAEVEASAKKWGMVKEEKRRIGFASPNNKAE